MRIEILILVYLQTATAFFQSRVSNRQRGLRSRRFQPPRRNGETRIIAGKEAIPNEYPYHVALRSWDDNWWLSGALITERWVITSGCAVKLYLPEKNTMVLLGAHIPDNVENTQQLILTDRQIVHRSYEDWGVDYNIALLHLKLAAKLNKFVSTVTLAPSDASDFVGARLRMTAFGKTSVWDVIQSRRLRYLVRYGMVNSVCQKKRLEHCYNCYVHNDHVCVETTEDEGACMYDQGAPLVDVDSGLLVGVLADDLWQCSLRDMPEMYTRVSYYYTWIMDKMT